MQDENITGYGLCECGCGERTRLAPYTRKNRGWVRGQPMRFIAAHVQRGLSRARGPYYVVRECGYKTPCWIWQRFTRPDGYGVFVRDGETLAHRVYFRAAGRVIPEGLELDHLCRIRPCVNPDHLELVTSAENNRRGVSFAAINAAKTHCHKGHEFTAANTYAAQGGRGCRACRRLHRARFDVRRKPDDLERIARNLGRHVAIGALDESDTFDALVDAAVAAGHPANGARASVRSGLTAGMRRA